MTEAATPIQLAMALTNGCTNAHLKAAWFTVFGIVYVTDYEQ
jgi:hypothetical protein